jgi:hypothetical protein
MRSLCQACADAHIDEMKIMKKLLTMAAILSVMPFLANADVNNIYGNGGVETAAFATEAEAISAANNEMAKIKDMTSEDLAYVLRTPHKNLRHDSLELVDTEVKTREKNGQYTGFVDVEYRFSRINK